MTAILHLGDCLGHLRDMPDNSIDAVVTDPPYGLSAPPDIAVVLSAWLSGEAYKHAGPGFMGRDWDSFVPGPRVWREVFRVLKPGGHAVVFAGTRTVDLMGIAVRLGGFEVRDCGQWCYWSGFPKSLDLSKEMDRLAGASDRREAVGSKRCGDVRGLVGYGNPEADKHKSVTAPATDNAKRYAGWGTALKPAVEPWLLLRKPIDPSCGSIARNVLRWGTGGLNIDACRFAPGDPMWVGPDEPWGERINLTPTAAKLGSGSGSGGGAEIYAKRASVNGHEHALGRFPANLIHAPKASRTERETGCEGLPVRTGAEATHREEDSDGLKSPRAGAGRTADGIRNHHPTVKPLIAMQWLVRLVTPEGGTVLDPFMGSGTTGMAAVGQGFDFVGCELEADHMQIARARIEYAAAGGAVDCDLEDTRTPPMQRSMF